MPQPTGQAPKPRPPLDDRAQPRATVELEGSVVPTEDEVLADASTIGRTMLDGAISATVEDQSVAEHDRMERQWADIIDAARPAVAKRVASGSGTAPGGSRAPRQSRSGSIKDKATKPTTQALSQEALTLDEWVEYYAETHEPTARAENELQVGSENSSALANEHGLRREIRMSVDRTLDELDSLPPTTDPDEQARRDRIRQGCAAMHDVIDMHTPEEEFRKEVRTQLRSETIDSLVHYNDAEKRIQSAKRDRNRKRGEADELKALQKRREEVAKITAAVLYFQGGDRVAFERAILRDVRRLADRGGAHRDILSSYATMMKGIKLEEGLFSSLESAFAAAPGSAQDSTATGWVIRRATIREDIIGRRDVVVTVPLAGGSTVSVSIDVKARRPYEEGLTGARFTPIPGCNGMFAAKRHPETGEWLLVVNAEDRHIGGGLRSTGDPEIPDAFELTDPPVFAREFMAAVPHFLRFIASQQRPGRSSTQP